MTESRYYFNTKTIYLKYNRHFKMFIHSVIHENLHLILHNGISLDATLNFDNIHIVKETYFSKSEQRKLFDI